MTKLSSTFKIIDLKFSIKQLVVPIFTILVLLNGIDCYISVPLKTFHEREQIIKTRRTNVNDIQEIDAAVFVDDQVAKDATDISKPLIKADVGGKPGLGFYIELGLGTPPQELSILVDTGSSNFAVAAAAHPFVTTYYEPDNSSTYESSSTEVYVPYTQGEWHGRLGTDMVTIPSDPNSTVRAHIVGIYSSEKFFINGSEWQGILGMAYSSIARPGSWVTTYFDSLVDGNIVNDIFSMQLCTPYSIGNHSSIHSTGSMTFGGIDKDLYQGEIFYTRIKRKWYFDVTVTDMGTNNTSLGLDCKEYNFDKSIVDSGTTNLRLPYKVFKTLIAAISRQIIDVEVPDTFWQGTEVMCWEIGTTPFYHFPTVYLDLEGPEDDTSFRLTIPPEQYIRWVNGNEPGKDCYKTGFASSTTGTVIGAVVMEGYYVVFDRENNRVGFAISNCAVVEGNETLVKISGPRVKANSVECIYDQSHSDTVLVIVSYVMAGLCVVSILPVVILYGYHSLKTKLLKRRRHSMSSTDGEPLHQPVDESSAYRDAEYADSQSQE
ncbi:beta-secretase 1-like isoform X2 [Anneissia japonica]|uniref:beta-secretase 1-like isoform X2 n=1 Tax=Anneissia japonica TaxID=1529436 RepID=UPI0014257E16|nr:beta-secretase 1-like isoform X2 [Anneissia japonica]